MNNSPHRAFGGVSFLLGLGVGLALSALARTLANRPEEDIALYRQVRDAIGHSFVRDVDRRDLLDDALRGAVGSLDPYSRYFSGEELSGFERETAGRFKGIGVVFRRPLSEARILFPMADSPAHRAGLRVGDRLLSIDGVSIEQLGPAGMQQALQASASEALVVELEDRAGARRNTRIEPAEVVDPTVRHVDLVDSELGIGYVSIRSFSHETPVEFDTAIATLEARGLRGLIIDLRGNPGGILDSAVRVADRFLERGTIVTTRSRSSGDDEGAEASSDDRLGLPLVVLIDPDSASASEVLAGALQDHRVAVVAGEPSYGKGAVQSVLRLDDERAIVKITTAYYATPAGRILERELSGNAESGIVPDIVVHIDDATRRRVREHLESYDPPPSVLHELETWEHETGEVLLARAPLDPQLDAALALLRGDPHAGLFR